MTFSMDMDLNASPVPDDDEQQPYDEPVEVEYAQEEHVESAVATLRRVRNYLHWCRCSFHVLCPWHICSWILLMIAD